MLSFPYKSNKIFLYIKKGLELSQLQPFKAKDKGNI